MPTLMQIQKGLKANYPELSSYEIVTLSIQVERNQILKRSLTPYSEKEPTPLESIAKSLGFSLQPETTITEVLKNQSLKL